MKYLFLLFLLMFSMVASAAGVCIPKRDEIKIQDEELRFSSMVITDSTKVLLKSKHRNDDIEINCEALTDLKEKYEDPSKNWTAKAQFGFSKWETIFPALALRKLSRGEVRITNKNEFPIRTSISIFPQDRTIKVIDESGDSKKTLTVKCLSPQGVDVSVSDGKSYSDIYSRGNNRRFGLLTNDGIVYAPPAPSGALPADPAKMSCENQTYSVDIGGGSLVVESSDKTNQSSELKTIVVPDGTR